jgi:hypothetical protein
MESSFTRHGAAAAATGELAAAAAADVDEHQGDELAAAADVDEDGEIVEQLAEELAEQLADRLAAAVVDKLGGVPAAIPAAIGAELRAHCLHGWRAFRQVIPLSGPSAIFADYRLHPDGRIEIALELDAWGVFWRGTLRPLDVDLRTPAAVHVLRPRLSSTISSTPLDVQLERQLRLTHDEPTALDRAQAPRFRHRGRRPAANPVRRS